MKKILIVSVLTFLFMLLVCSCEDFEYPIIEVPDTETENPAAADQTIPDLTRFIFIGESSEVIDGVNYTVRTYADANTDLPYRYVIYKAYYLNGVIKRVFTFNHTEGVCLDVPYTEFTEHMCGSGCSSTVSTYSENGMILTQTVQTNTEKTVFGFYDNGKVSEKAVYNNNGMLIDEESYYEDGSLKQKHLVLYELAEAIIAYLPDGKRQRVTYIDDGVKSSSVVYDYYSNGSIRSWSRLDSEDVVISSRFYTIDGRIDEEDSYQAGKLNSYRKYYYQDDDHYVRYCESHYYSDLDIISNEYVENEKGNRIVEINYNSNGNISSWHENYMNDDGSVSTTKLEVSYYYEESNRIGSFSYYYESGYLKYRYSGYDSKLWIYDDNITRYHNESVASTITNPYLPEQAKSLVTSLRYSWEDLIEFNF